MKIMGIVFMTTWIALKLSPVFAEQSSLSSSVSHIPIQILVPEMPDIRMVTPEELSNEGYTVQSKEQPYLFGDFNSDGQRDIAMCLIRETKSEHGTGYLLIATESEAGWIRHYFGAIGFSLPYVGWDPKDGVLYVSSPIPNDGPWDEVRWNSEAKTYEALPLEPVEYP